ncbi:MAG: nucleotidyltransferase family protein [Bdellovibrio sp.]|nr:nucleotidyltransferase family protein [Bdellovibrio sp.]
MESTIIIKRNQTLKQAMEILNTSALHICFVIGDNGELIGSLTDGDVRRGFLKGATLESSVADYMNPAPKTIPEGLSVDEIVKHMNTWGVRQLPVVNKFGMIIKVETVEGVMHLFQKSNRVILMAGGFGKRLSPLTDHIPKPLLQVDGVPILEHILRRFKELGFYRFTVSLNYKADMIMDHFGDGSRLGLEIDYLHEDKPLGTCGALSLLKEKPTEPFFVMNGDLLTRANFSTILEYHSSQKSFATMCVREHSFEVPYGVVKSDGNKIISIEEKPKEITFINAGIYVLSPEVLDYIDSNNYLDMPTLFMNLAKKDKNILSCVLRDYWLDIGRMEDFHRAQTDYEKYYKL